MWGSTNATGVPPIEFNLGDSGDGVLTEGRTLVAGVDYIKYQDFAILELEAIDWNPDEEETLTVDEPCRGLIILVNGNVYIGTNAKISMAKKGSILPAHPEELLSLYGSSDEWIHIVDKLKMLKGGAGGNGGAASQYSGTPGTGGLGRVCQGGFGGGAAAGGYDRQGGDGGSVIYPEVIGRTGGTGGYGTPNHGDGLHGWNGGSGGPAERSTTNDASSPSGISQGAAGGAGGAGNSSTRGQDGEHTGGFILIIAKGNVTIHGTLDVSGGNGGAGGSGTARGGGGGGAGGGVIAIFSQMSIDVSAANIQKDGGAGGAGHQNGTGGQQGTFYTEVLDL